MYLRRFRISEPINQYHDPSLNDFGEDFGLLIKRLPAPAKKRKVSVTPLKGRGCFFCVVGTTGSWLVRQVAKNCELFC